MNLFLDLRRFFFANHPNYILGEIIRRYLFPSILKVGLVLFDKGRIDLDFPIKLGLLDSVVYDNGLYLIGVYKSFGRSWFEAENIVGFDLHR